MNLSPAVLTRIFLLLCTGLLPLRAQAKIYQLATPSDQGFSLYWWPILPPLPGWHQDEQTSEANAANILVPNGATFANAPAIIYGKADYKPRMQGINSLAQFIAQDHANFAQSNPGVRITEMPPLRDGDGQSLPCYAFTPAKSGQWDIVAYGEEGDYYLIFTDSGLSAKAAHDALPAFQKLISVYKENP